MLDRIIAATALAVVLPAPAVEAQGLGAGATADWGGRYGGVTAGAVRSTGEASRGDFSGDLITLDVANGLFPDSIDDAEVAAIGGVTLGYNLQRGAFVGGGEIDLSLSGLDVAAGFSRVDPNPDPPFTGVNTITGYGTEVDGLLTARLRAGRAFGGTLVYATGGLAVGRVENSFSLDLPELGYAASFSESGDRAGYTLGAGVERLLSDRLSVKAEVLYVDLEDTTVEARDPQTFPGNALDYEFDNAGTIAHIGVNFRF